MPALNPSFEIINLSECISEIDFVLKPVCAALRRVSLKPQFILWNLIFCFEIRYIFCSLLLNFVTLREPFDNIIL